MTVHCKTCGHQWEVPMKLPMPILRAVQAMRGCIAAGCPACGAHGSAVICGEAPAAGGRVEKGTS